MKAPVSDSVASPIRAPGGRGDGRRGGASCPELAAGARMLPAPGARAGRRVEGRVPSRGW